MATVATARGFLRPSRTIIRHTSRRQASSTSEAANTVSSQAAKAKESASSAVSRASEGLSKVTSSASSALSKAGPAISGRVSQVGGRTGRALNFFQSLVPPTIYYSRVALELSKLVARGQNISTPTVSQFQTSFQPLINAIRHPSTLFSQNPGLLQPQQYLESARNVDRKQLIGAGVLLVEVLGFYHVGKMIGRFKVVGYRGEAQESGHH